MTDPAGKAGVSEAASDAAMDREHRKMLMAIKISEEKAKRAEQKASHTRAAQQKKRNRDLKNAMLNPVPKFENIGEAPTLYPTAEEMKDPVLYMESIRSVGEEYGIVKIVLPPECRDYNTALRPDFEFKPRSQRVGFNGKAGFGVDDPVKLADFVEEGNKRKLEFLNCETVEGGVATDDMVERLFWHVAEQKKKTDVRYGVDVEDHAFVDYPESALKEWALSRIAHHDRGILNHLDTNMPGVTSPFYYIGMLFSMFCWHNEDNYLYSMSLLHSGATKTWYGVPGKKAGAFVKALGECSRKCVFSKTQMIPPSKLAEKGIPIYRTHQKPGEIVVTFPESFHAGFSHGFTYAEAVNFAMYDWLPSNRKAIHDYRVLLKGSKSPIINHEQLMMKVLRNITRGIGVVDGESSKIIVREAKEFLMSTHALYSNAVKLVLNGHLDVDMEGAYGSTQIVSNEDGTRSLVEQEEELYSTEEELTSCMSCNGVCYLGAVYCYGGPRKACIFCDEGLPRCLHCVIDSDVMCKCPRKIAYINTSYHAVSKVVKGFKDSVGENAGVLSDWCDVVQYCDKPSPFEALRDFYYVPNENAEASKDDVKTERTAEEREEYKASEDVNVVEEKTAGIVMMEGEKSGTAMEQNADEEFNIDNIADDDHCGPRGKPTVEDEPVCGVETTPKETPATSPQLSIDDSEFRNASICSPKPADTAEPHAARMEGTVTIYAESACSGKKRTRGGAIEAVPFRLVPYGDEDSEVDVDGVDESWNDGLARKRARTCA